MTLSTDSKILFPILVGVGMAALAGWQVAGWKGFSVALAVWFSLSFTALAFIEAVLPERSR